MGLRLIGLVLLLMVCAVALPAQTRTDTLVTKVAVPRTVTVYDTVVSRLVTTYRDSVLPPKPPVDTARPPVDTVKPPVDVGNEPVATSRVLHSNDFTNGRTGYATRGTLTSAGGRNGGAALRFSYSAASPDNLIEFKFEPSTDVYVRYYYRVTSAGGPIVNIGGSSGMKWFMLWRENGPRYTNGVGYLGDCRSLYNAYTATFCNTGLEFSVHDNGSPEWSRTDPRSQPNPFVQNVSKAKTFKNTADGQWHKYTVHTVTNLAGGTGYEEVWIDDVKIIDTRDRGYTHHPGAFNLIQLPGLVVSGCCSPNFTIDVDDLIVWRN